MGFLCVVISGLDGGEQMSSLHQQEILNTEEEKSGGQDFYVGHEMPIRHPTRQLGICVCLPLDHSDAANESRPQII